MSAPSSEIDLEKTHIKVERGGQTVQDAASMEGGLQRCVPSARRFSHATSLTSTVRGQVAQGAASAGAPVRLVDRRRRFVAEGGADSFLLTLACPLMTDDCARRHDRYVSFLSGAAANIRSGG